MPQALLIQPAKPGAYFLWHRFLSFDIFSAGTTVASMDTIKIDNHIELQYDKLPKSWVFYTLQDADTCLSCGYSYNLRKRIRSIKAKAEDDRAYREMWDRASSLQWQEHSCALNALVQNKCFLQNQLPEYQEAVLPWREYVYLGIDALSFPFISITENTQGDAIYLGPFRSRFWLVDLIDTYARILKLPQCETGNYPCDKYTRGSCSGWCLNLEETPADKDIPTLEKLDSLLKEAFVHPENGILELVQRERDKYFNDLEFIKASLLDDELELLAKYRSWLKFLYVAKQLELDTPELKVAKGRISRCRFEGKDYHFPVDNTAYRKNESLALDLAYLDECRIIYDYLIKQEK